MLHRDIKPGNILLTPSAEVKVADFGIVKTAGSVHTTTGQIVGTLAYLSPDRIAGQPAAISDDLYAVGVVGYEALTGRKPFIEEDIAPLARAIADDDPPPLHYLRPDVDPCLNEVVGRAMSKDPQRRFGSAEDMLAALGGAASSAVVAPGAAFDGRRRPPTRVMTVHTAAPSAAFAVPAPHRKHRSMGRRAAGAAAVIGALAVAALAFALDSSTTSPPATPEPASVSTPTSVAAVPPPVVAPPPSPEFQPVDAGNDNAPKGNGRDGAGSHGNGHGKKPK
jgi:serine/threonine-protein kinase